MEIAKDMVFDNVDLLFMTSGLGITVENGNSVSFNNCNLRKSNDESLCCCMDGQSGSYIIRGAPTTSLIFEGCNISEAIISSNRGFMTYEDCNILNSRVKPIRVHGFILHRSFVENSFVTLQDCTRSFITGTSIEEGELNFNGGDYRCWNDYIRRVDVEVNDADVEFFDHNNIFMGTTTVNGNGGDLLMWNSIYMYTGGEESPVTGEFDAMDIRHGDWSHHGNGPYLNVSGADMELINNHFDCRESGVQLNGCDGLINRNNFEGSGLFGLNLVGCDETDIRCNSFSGYDVAIMGDDGIGDQGHEGFGAGNIFEGNGNDIEINNCNGAGIDYFRILNGDDDPESCGVNEQDAEEVCNSDIIRQPLRCGIKITRRSEDCPGGVPTWVVQTLINRYGTNCITFVPCGEVRDPCDNHTAWVSEGENHSEENPHPCETEGEGEGEDGGSGEGPIGPIGEVEPIGDLGPIGNMGLDSEGDNVNSFSMYPNPSNGDVNLDFDSEVDESSTVKIFTVQGKLMESFMPKGNKLKFSTDQYEPGLYLVQLYKNERMEDCKRLIVIK